MLKIGVSLIKEVIMRASRGEIKIEEILRQAELPLRWNIFFQI